MTSARLSFCFGVHNHQPIGKFDSVLAEATTRAYRPVLHGAATEVWTAVTVSAT